MILKGAFAVIILAAFTCHGHPVKSDTPLDKSDEKLSVANNHFAVELLKHLDSGKNIFFSPYSVTTALAMLHAGAKGDTKSELSEGLGFTAAGLDDADVLHAFEHRRHRLQAAQNSTVLDEANSIVTLDGYQPLETYVHDLSSAFDAELRQVDFVNKGGEAVEDINAWVKEKTHGKIEKLLEQELGDDTRLVLLNAIYFKGLWKNRFNENDTLPLPFYNGGVEEINTPTMILTTRLAHASDDVLEADIVELPYEDSAFSLVVVLPKERNGIEALKKDLTAEKLHDALSKAFFKKVTLTLPKFKLEGSYKLKETLRDLGVKSAFGDADLSGINGEKDLLVDNVIHKAVVEVNEEGSEAAGATAVVIVTRLGAEPSYVTSVTVDHPFLFFIRDAKAGDILFLGQVNSL
ncbi:intracellular coagulation inhibitor 1-like isoform X2 [Ornithodoros turicata]